jgi:hypothetical protein
MSFERVVQMAIFGALGIGLAGVILATAYRIVVWILP